jgi:hypothetical protein
MMYFIIHDLLNNNLFIYELILEFIVTFILI